MTGTISAVMRAIIDRVYPVGIIIDFAAETNPNTAVGCGTQWQRIVDGRTLIASDASHPVGWAGGEEVHVLTGAEMPNHTHGFIQAGTDGDKLLMTVGKDGSYGGENFLAFGTSVKPFAESVISITYSGGDVAHNNMQPSLAVARWKRVA